MYEPSKIIGSFFESSKKIMDRKIPELEDYRVIASGQVPSAMKLKWNAKYPGKKLVPAIEVMESVEDVSASIHGNLLPGYAYANVRAGNTDDEREVDIVQDVLTAYANLSCVADVFDVNIYDSEVDGFCLVVTEWGKYDDGMSEGPLVKVIPVNRWYPQCHKRNIATHREWEIIQEITSYNEVFEDAEVYGYDKKELKKILDIAKTDNYSPPDSILRPMQNWESGLADAKDNDPEHDNPPLELLHFWYYTKDRKVAVQTFVNRQEDFPLRHIYDPSGFNELPVIVGHITRPTSSNDRIFPGGIVEALFPQWIIATLFQSYAIAEAKYAMIAGGKVIFNKDQNLPNLLDLNPGDVIPLDIEKGQVFDVKMHIQELFGTSKMAGNNIHRLAGSNDYSAGVNPQESETAHGAKYLMMGAAKKIAPYNRRLFSSLMRPVYKRMLKLVGNHAKINDVQNLIGEKWIEFPQEKLKKALSRSWDFVPIQPSEAEDPQTKQAKATAVISMFRQDPDVDQYALKYRTLLDFGIMNIDQILPPPERKRVAIKSEHEALIQGVYISPKPEEDLFLHFKEHLMFFAALKKNPDMIPIPIEISGNPEAIKDLITRVAYFTLAHIQATGELIAQKAGGQAPMGMTPQGLNQLVGHQGGMPGMAPGNNNKPQNRVAANYNQELNLSGVR